MSQKNHSLHCVLKIFILKSRKDIYRPTFITVLLVNYQEAAWVPAVGLWLKGRGAFLQFSGICLSTILESSEQSTQQETKLNADSPGGRCPLLPGLLFLEIFWAQCNQWTMPVGTEGAFQIWWPSFSVSFSTMHSGWWIINPVSISKQDKHSRLSFGSSAPCERSARVGRVCIYVSMISSVTH